MYETDAEYAGMPQYPRDAIVNRPRTTAHNFTSAKKHVTTTTMKTSTTSASSQQSSSEEGSESSGTTSCVNDAKKRLTPAERAIRKALLNRSYHLPGNSYTQDLYQYLVNNHPFLGIFLYHPLHPVGIGMRMLTFFGSIVFGLTITNIIYMAFILEDQPFNKALVNVTFTNHAITGNVAIDNQVTHLEVTNGLIALWTVGSALNGLYDNLIWSVAACACCLEGGRYEHLLRYRKFLPLIVMFLVVGTAAAASLVVLIVATVRSTDKNEQTAKLLGISYDTRAHSYRFLLSYGIEVLFSLAVWYPLMGALLFSGVLGCGRMPVFGGRPYEMRALERKETADEPEEQGQELTLTVSGTVNLDDTV